VKLSWKLPYPSRRMPVFARNIVASSQPLAAQAGLQMLARGGNAMDAALAAAITLTVVEPCSNGIGSDAFAIVWDGERLHGLNASGRAPKAWSAERFAGRNQMPARGWDSVTVPGAVSAWVALSERLGALPFTELFKPAIAYAREGFLVSPVIGMSWAVAATTFREFPEFAAAFLPDGRAPRIGERFCFPDQAETLEAIADTRGKAFYRGALAERMVAHSTASGGALTLEDLAEHRADWVSPIRQEYRGMELHEIPPNGQGLAALIALGVLRHHPLGSLPVDSVDSVHLQIEAMKVGLAEATRHIADPETMQVSVNELLDDSLLEERGRGIDMQRAAFPKSALPSDHGTVYLTAADAAGMMVSFIQSNYVGFGSGVVVPGTGISLQNRGLGFSLEPGHPNCVGGGKRPFHTIIPGFLTEDGAARMSFGVMGGPMQAQGHVQMAVRMLDYAQNPQAAADAPRWHVHGDGGVGLEPAFGPDLVDQLQARGHPIAEGTPPWLFGGAQLIWRLDEGYCAASEPRKDGQAVGF